MTCWANSEPYDPPDAAFRHVDDDRAIWTWRINGGMLHLYIFQADPNQLSLPILDPKDGAVTPGEQVAFRFFSGDSYFGPDILSWQDTMMWVAADSKLLGIDVAAAEVKYQFP